ncbi:zinc-binding dehydrogenase [Patulibacter sp. SYSU D01012]|uniref:zinc-binding dehydrogenase n=1 Tax=Patulibacter sp. SYSU D01012 TaxID=2817381 RepID=UPI001B301C6A|nr:zinc-binding dehydrogenase [Patulibacter sp. SYSU D01012]
MRVLAYHGPDDLRLEDRADPEPGPGEALLRVRSCGVCGTDLRIQAGHHRAYGPGTVRVPGHEIAGDVVALGDGTDLALGRAFVAPNLGCGRCPQCLAGRENICASPNAIGITRDGGFAEYVLLGEDVIAHGSVMPVPDELDPAPIALVEPLACVLRGARACSVGPGDVVLVVGAGPIGLMHVLVARAKGAARVVVSEPSERRRAQAEAFGADVTVDPTSQDVAALVAEQTEGRGVDVVITAAPIAATQAQALELAATGGRINFFGGLPRGRSEVVLDTNLIHYKELVVTGTTACTRDDCREALDLVLAGRIDTPALVSERLPLEDALQGFAAARAGEALRVVLEP